MAGTGFRRRMTTIFRRHSEPPHATVPTRRRRAAKAIKPNFVAIALFYAVIAAILAARVGAVMPVSPH